MGVNNLVVSTPEERVGKIIRVYFDENGNQTIVELEPNEMEKTERKATLVGSHRLSSEQTKQMEKNIQGINQATKLASILAPFIPNPYAKAFLAASKVSIFAQDVRYAGIYGKSIIMREYCNEPHTSYSHYYEYQIV